MAGSTSELEGRVDPGGKRHAGGADQREGGGGSGRVGAAAAKRRKTPKAALDPINRRGVVPSSGHERTHDRSRAHGGHERGVGLGAAVEREPGQQGQETWKLKASVLTSAIIASGMASAGVAATYRIAARRAPGSAGRTGGGELPRSICRSAITITG